MISAKKLKGLIAYNASIAGKLPVLQTLPIDELLTLPIHELLVGILERIEALEAKIALMSMRSKVVPIDEAYVARRWPPYKAPKRASKRRAK